MYPGIPYHCLRELRRLLEQTGYFAQPGLVTVNGYVRTLWRLAREHGFGLRLNVERQR